MWARGPGTGTSNRRLDPEAALAPSLTTLVLLLAAAGGLALPLHDILTHPQSLSVLPSLQVDAATYDAIGWSIARSPSLHAIPPRQPPGFVMLLAMVYAAVGHSWVAAKLVLWAALAGSTALAGWLAQRVWGGRAAAVAALLTATSPALRHYVGTIQYEVAVAFGLLSVLVLCAQAIDAARARTMLSLAAAAGLAGGILALTREVFLGVVPLLAVWLALSLRRRSDQPRALLAALLFLAMASAPIAAWSIAQSRAHGQAILISDKGPVTFALGNNPAASGTYNVDRSGEPAGLAFVMDTPAAAARLAGRKALYFWGVLRDGWNVPRPAALWVHRASAGLVPFAAVLPLARGGWLLAGFLLVVGTLLARRALGTWWILPGVVLAVMSAHVITLSSHRFAVPVLPVVFILISGPLAALLRRAGAAIARRRWRALVAGAVLVAAVALQWRPARLEIRYPATTLDAMNEVDREDAALGRPVRLADAARGRRAVMILSDEFLPGGQLRVTIRARRGAAAVAADVAVARTTIIAAGGAVACAEDIPAGILFEDRFTDVWQFCGLHTEGPATVIVETLGVADLAFDAVTLTWPPPGDGRGSSGAP